MNILKSKIVFEENIKYDFYLYATKERQEKILNDYNFFKAFEDKYNYANQILFNSELIAGYTVEEFNFYKIESITVCNDEYYWNKIIHYKGEKMQITIGAVNKEDIENILKDFSNDYSTIKIEAITNPNLKIEILDDGNCQ